MSKTCIFSPFKSNLLKVSVNSLTRDDIAQHGISIPHGWGETYWFKNYKVEHFLDKYKEADVSKIVSYTNELFV